MEINLEKSAAIKALGSLFKLTQVFLRDDSYEANRETLPVPGSSLCDKETSDDMELSRQLGALGLPMSFHTSKRSNGIVKGRIKNRKQKHSYGHEGNEGVIELSKLSEERSVLASSELFYHSGALDTEKVQYISDEDGLLEILTSVTCAGMEEPECQEFTRVTSEYSLNSDGAKYSESSEVLDRDEADSKVIGDSEVWASYWDSFYNRYYFYNTRTNDSTWDPPPGMEHLAICEVVDKPDAIISDIVENLDTQCSVDSYGECIRNDQLVDQIPRDSCLSFELSEENFHGSINISAVNLDCENLSETIKIEKGCFQESTLINLQEYSDRCEIKELEENVICNIFQSPKISAVHVKTEDDQVIRKKKKKAKNRTRLNRKSSISSAELQFQGIVEEGMLEEQGIFEELSSSIIKYWCQRYILFSRYDHGIKMDKEGWFSATPEHIAKHHASRCGDGVLVDCFTGVGGNAIQFAKKSKHVIAIDIDPKKIEYAQHNAAIYGVSNNIDFVVGDSFVLAPTLKADTVFLSPPWGGPNYLKATTYDVNTMLKPHSGIFLFNAVKGIASKVVMFLPRTVDLNQLAELSLSANPPWSLEVERNFLNGKLKAITAYFTNVSLCKADDAF